MSRELKFRAWDGVNMVYPDWIAIVDGGKYWQPRPNNNYETENFPLMQFTGLKDKNGKEIYEGDIIKFSHFEERKNGVVIYQVDSYRLSVGSWLCDFGATDAIDGLEIIGNIYENPNLSV